MRVFSRSSPAFTHRRPSALRLLWRSATKTGISSIDSTSVPVLRRCSRPLTPRIFLSASEAWAGRVDEQLTLLLFHHQP